ncbi:regulatory protein TetR [Mycolicibacterium rhodesiae JS60]|nr:regulatory protein TetR [Mycolicibacterium rhodesiae JS60]
MATRTQPGPKAVATRRRLVLAAAQLLGAKGYAATRLSDIAEAAEIQTGSLYYHFSSREDLVREVLTTAAHSITDRVIARVDALDPATSGVDRIRVAVLAHIEAVLESSDYSAAMLRLIGQLPADIEADARRARQTYSLFWRRLFESAQAEGALRDDLNLKAVRQLVLGGLNALPEWFHPVGDGGRLSERGLADHVSGILLDGLATEQGLRRWRHDRERLPASPSPTNIPAVQTDSGNGDSKAAATKLRILDAAAEVFRIHGYAGARLADIAAEAQLQTGSLYYHFDSRTDIVEQLVRISWDNAHRAFDEALASLPPDAAPITRLGAVLDAHVRSVTCGAYTAGVMAILSQLPEPVRELHRPFHEAYLRNLHTLLQDATDSGDIKGGLDISALLMFTIGALNRSFEWYDEAQHIAIDQLAIQVQKVYFEGMRAQRD